MSGRPVSLIVSVYSGHTGRSCGVKCGKLIGRVSVSVDLKGAEIKPIVFQCGWVKIGKEGNESKVVEAMVHLVIRSEPDHRFVFQFGGEPECSPVVSQIQGSICQPVFSCKFSADRSSRSRFSTSKLQPRQHHHRHQQLSVDCKITIRRER